MSEAMTVLILRVFIVGLVVAVSLLDGPPRGYYRRLSKLAGIEVEPEDSADPRWRGVVAPIDLGRRAELVITQDHIVSRVEAGTGWERARTGDASFDERYFLYAPLPR